MRPLAYTFPYAVVFWVTFLWAFVREAGIVSRAQKGAAEGGAPDDKGSLRFLLLAQGLWVGVVIATLLSIVGYGYRVRVEERALTTTLGDTYRAYAASTKRFIPFVI